MICADDCAFNVVEYNTPLSVAAIFIILIASLVGAGLPGAFSLSSRSEFTTIVKILSYAGAGVLLSTAFIHLLLPSYEALASPCLPDSWLNRYPSWAFLFCVITIAMIQIADFLLTTLIQRRLAASTTSHNAKDPTAVATTTTSPCVVHTHCKDEECGGRPLLPTTTSNHLQYTAVLLAEASIAVHSVLIGLALGLAGANEIVPLLVALTFHQMLEGVALGTAAVEAGMGVRSYVTLVLVFALTTPIGTAIGVGVHRTKNPNGVPGLLVTGILDSVCAGLLIFLSFGDHINAFKSQAGWLREQGSVWVTASCLAAFAAGVGVMSAIGFWA